MSRSRFIALSQADAAALGVSVPGQADLRLAGKFAHEVKGKPLTGDVKAPAYEVSDLFDFQSYFDNALGERALFRQAPNQLIVPSTLSDPIQVTGYGLALHPSSETPVAVQFETGGQQGQSQVYRLKPGELVRPQGQGDGFNPDGSFSGFRWGLPFGWLGGGSATLVVLRSPNARVEWASDHNEVVYHRIRLKIWDPTDGLFPAAAGVYNGPLNWPQRFPWPAAIFGTSSLTQRGQPGLAVMPTRTAMSLRLSTLANSADMRIFFVGADVWASSGPNAITGLASISLSDVRFTDYTWGQMTPLAGAVAPFSTALPQTILTGEMERIAANAGAVVLASTDPALQNQFVDVCRFGKL